ncbi:MAG: ATP-binding protein [Clostridia bacterium]|nr:ATP-binding protein [Clostridia bacterium]
MKRIEFEEKSKRIIDRYVVMLDAMNSSRVTDGISEDYAVGSYAYLKITEISNLWDVEERPLWNILTEVFVSLHSLKINVSTVINCDGNKIDVFIGGPIQYLEVIKNTYSGIFPQIQFSRNESDNDAVFDSATVLNNQNWSNGGFLKGNSTGSENFKFSNQLEKVVRGMKNKKWQISIFATPVSKSESIVRQHMWLTLATECSQLSDVTYTDSDNVETTSYKKSYFHSEQYNKKIQAFVEKLEESIAVGEWSTVINFAATSNDDAGLLGGLLSSAYLGEESIPEPVHPVYHRPGCYHRLIDAGKYTHNNFCKSDYPVYGTLLSSKELAVYSAPPVVDTAGFGVKDYVAFDVNREIQGDLSVGHILENGNPTNNEYLIDINEFNRHCLVIGLTGSGKTNTLKSLICSVGKNNSKRKPFLIIEPAKKEYWELYKLGFDDLRIYSVGSSEPNASRLCINPFERVSYKDVNGNVKSVSIQTHIDFVYAAFKASFIMYTPMPYVLEKAIYSIYEDYGWDIDNNVNRNGVEVYPTIEDLYFKIPQIVTEMGYDSKMRNDLIGSLQARINSLRIGSKGSALNVKKSFPMEHLLENNTIIEIEDIGDDDVKAFIISLLLIKVLEYRRQQEDCQLEIRHLLLIEEAHRLLKNVQSGTGENADPRGAAVEFFCNMLAEMRSKGQGFVVADQIPSKLAPDLIKNTNLKIVHRTVAEDERTLMGGAMNMTDEQIAALSTLKQGVAAVYSEGDNRPKLVKPVYANSFMLDSRKYISRQDVICATQHNCIDIRSDKGYEVLTNKRSAICRACKCFCECIPEDVLNLLADPGLFIRFSRSINPLVTQTCKICDVNTSLENFINSNPSLRSSNVLNSKNCLMNCLIEQWDIRKKDKALFSEIERIYINEIIGK